jgi:hypothetical protein
LSPGRSLQLNVWREIENGSQERLQLLVTEIYWPTRSYNDGCFLKRKIT